MVFTTTNKAANKLRQGIRRSVNRTSLDSFERYNADNVWRMQMGNRTVVPTLVEVLQLVERLQIPMQPMIRQVVEGAFSDRNGNFGHSDFVLLLEQCKTLHQRWLYKVRGKQFDDDLLEAFIAVGGESDSTGEVDFEVINQVVKDFNLVLPSLAKMQDGSSPPPHGTATSPKSASINLNTSNVGGATNVPHLQFMSFVDMLKDDKGKNACLSNMLYLRDHDLDENDDGTATKHSSAGPTPTHSRRASVAGQRGSNNSNMLPSVQNGNNSHASRSKTSMSGVYGGSTRRDGTSPSPTRSSSKATGVTRLPMVARPPKEKKSKFANW